MESSFPNPPVAPSPEAVQLPSSAPRVLGALNIAFGGLLLLCGGATLVQALVAGPMTKAMVAQQQAVVQQQQQAMEAAQKAQVEAQIAHLRQRQLDAETEEERAAYEAEIQSIRNASSTVVATAPIAPTFAMPQQQPEMIAYSVSDAVSGLILNVLMVVSGIGLLQIRRWGRSLALWVAGLKIVRLIASQTAFVLVGIPAVLQQMQGMFSQMPSGPNAEMDEFLPWMGVFYMIYAVVMVIVGSIYPVVLLWLLNTRRARAMFVREESPVAPVQGS